MKTFYNKLLAVFETAENKAKFTAQDISPVLYIDIYAGQDQFEENFELFSQPAVLVDWDVDHKSDPPIATVTLYCCYEQLRDTSNISENREKGLKFLDYISTIDEVARTIESETTGKLVLQSEGFNKMDSIVDIYLFTYECSYSGRKNPLVYEEGNYDTMSVQTNLIRSVFED
jgi:hypothetical protein